MQKKTLIITSILLFAGLSLLFFYYFPQVFFLTFGGIALAYLLFPMVEHFQKKKISLPLAILLTYAIIGAILLFIIFVVMPVLYKESKTFFQNTHVYFNFLSEIWDWIVAKLNTIFSFSGMLHLEDTFFPMIESRMDTLAETLLDRFMALPMQVSYLLLSPVLAYYFLRDHDKISGGLLSIFPPHFRSDVLILSKEMDDVLWGFIKGNLLVSLIVGFLTGLGLFLLGVDYPLILGIIAGLMDIIPYFGPFLGGIPIVLFALLQPDVNLFLVLLLLIAIQQFENIFVSPRIIGDRVGLHPVLIILLVFVGGSLGGLLGMVLVIPIAAVFKVLGVYIYQRFVGFRFH